jgi:hypothetical protein
MEVPLTREAFAAQSGAKFQVEADAENDVELELVEVSEVKLSAHQEEFSLVFRGPRESFLGQGTRPFKNEALGRFSLFIVPIRNDEVSYYYEAVFNRFRDQ